MIISGAAGLRVVPTLDQEFHQSNALLFTETETVYCKAAIQRTGVSIDSATGVDSVTSGAGSSEALTTKAFLRALARDTLATGLFRAMVGFATQIILLVESCICKSLSNGENNLYVNLILSATGRSLRFMSF